MSFQFTQPQFRAQTKTVTRRVGWWNLKPGDRILGVEKGMGLKKGEKVKPLGIIEVVSTRREQLKRMHEDADYGFKEVELEGFKDHPVYGWPSQFVEWFAASHRCSIDSFVNRIEFRYVLSANNTDANK